MSANTPTKRLLPLLILLSLLFGLFPARAESEAAVDYAASVSPGEDTWQQEVTVASFIDGDTTHFFVSSEDVPSGRLKARYLAVNTPEITGKIEEYGQAAARFTRERLENAHSILIESDDESLHLDSTAGRYLMWIWYREGEDAPWRNLNIELLQNGLAVPYSASSGRYGEACVAAVSQAKREKLNLFSGEPDPDFYYGDAIELTLRELRTNPEEYAGKKVAFQGVVTTNWAQCVYLEAYDEETERYYGLPVYYGYSLSGGGLEILSVGNEARVVGVFTYYEAGASWQVSDVSYRMMRPDDPDNLQALSEGHSPAYTPSAALQLDELSVATSVSLSGLRVVSARTVHSEDVSTNGALVLSCQQDGAALTLWVAPNALNEALSPDALTGCLVDAKGIVFTPQQEALVRVFAPDGLTLHNN